MAGVAEPRAPAPEPEAIPTASTAEVMELILQATAVIFANGETTERTVAAAKQIGDAFGYRATSIPRWDQLAVRVDGPDGGHHNMLAVVPAGIDMNKVLQGEEAIDALREHTVPVEASRSTLARIAALPPVAPGRFVLAAAIGAAALAVVYGAGHLATLGLAGFSAGMGALIRRGLAKVSSNLFVQPFCAAFLAGLIGGIARQLQLGPDLALVALCPCMLLVPGPHFLNGLFDLVRARVAIGGSRIAFALLVIAAISAGSCWASRPSARRSRPRCHRGGSRCRWTSSRQALRCLRMAASIRCRGAISRSRSSSEWSPTVFGGRQSRLARPQPRPRSWPASS